jgi:hypothetical protein
MEPHGFKTLSKDIVLMPPVCSILPMLPSTSLASAS